MTHKYEFQRVNRNVFALYARTDRQTDTREAVNDDVDG